jgi:hypothetical protein
MELTMTRRQAVTKKKALAYRGAKRAGKSIILDERVDAVDQCRVRAGEGNPRGFVRC